MVALEEEAGLPEMIPSKVQTAQPEWIVSEEEAGGRRQEAGGRLARVSRTGGGGRKSRGCLVVGGGLPPGVDRVGAGGQELVPAEEEKGAAFSVAEKLS